MSNEPSAKNAVCLKSYGMREKNGVSGGEPTAAARHADERVVARRRQRLAVVALDVAVEAADHPLEAAFVVGGEPQFLGEHLDRRVVEQRRVEPHSVRRRRRMSKVTLPVSCEASRVTRMSRSVYELTDVSTAGPKSNSIVRSPRKKSSSKCSSSWRYCSRSPMSTRGSVVVNGLARMLQTSCAVVAVEVDVLVDDARRDHDVVGQLPAQRHAAALPLAVVHVLVDASRRGRGRRCSPASR